MPLSEIFKNSFGIYSDNSLLSSFVTAGAGIKVSKHGNYGVSSGCGSSNVLEELGVRFSNDEGFLKNYKYKKPFFLSGGIGIENVDELINMKNTNLPLYAIDVNSKFESQAGIKKLNLLKNFKSKLYEL